MYAKNLLNHMIDGLATDLGFISPTFFCLHNVPRDRCHLSTLSALVTLYYVYIAQRWSGYAQYGGQCVWDASGDSL